MPKSVRWEEWVRLREESSPPAEEQPKRKRKKPEAEPEPKGLFAPDSNDEEQEAVIPPPRLLPENDEEDRQNIERDRWDGCEPQLPLRTEPPDDDENDIYNWESNRAYNELMFDLLPKVRDRIYKVGMAVSEDDDRADDLVNRFAVLLRIAKESAFPKHLRKFRRRR